MLTWLNMRLCPVHLRQLHKLVEQRGLAAAKEPGEHRDRDGPLQRFARGLHHGQPGGADISLGGGLPKLRIAREGGGKSGGYRTIYALGRLQMPIFLIPVFAKNEKVNLTPTEQTAVASSKQLLGAYGAKV